MQVIFPIHFFALTYQFVSFSNFLYYIFFTLVLYRCLPTALGLDSINSTKEKDFKENVIKGIK